jgi:SAM-dependent methyltransferase
LDVGCGDGKLIYELAKTAAGQRLVGTDLSERAVALARAFNLGNGAEFSCERLSELSDEFDVITLVETLEHVPDAEIKPLAAELSRLLAPDGILVISVPTTVLPVSRKHYRHYDRQLLTSQLEEFFRPVSFDYEVKYNRLYRWLIKFYSIGCGLGMVNRLTGLISKKMLASANQKNGLHVVAVFRKKQII